MSYSRPPPNVGDLISLKVDSLTDRISHCTLRCIFEKYGPIGDVYIPRDHFRVPWLCLRLLPRQAPRRGGHGRPRRGNAGWPCSAGADGTPWLPPRFPPRPQPGNSSPESRTPEPQPEAWSLPQVQHQEPIAISGRISLQLLKVSISLL